MEQGFLEKGITVLFMNWLSTFLKLEYKQTWLCISAFLGSVAAGFLTIYQFKPELVGQDWATLKSGNNK